MDTKKIAFLVKKSPVNLYYYVLYMNMTPKEIKKEVNLHFQTVACSTNRPKDIFGRWHH
jgi:hypothetical protein